MPKQRKCRVCGCTDNNCRQCIEKTGSPCHRVEKDLCSACVPEPVYSKPRECCICPFIKFPVDCKKCTNAVNEKPATMTALALTRFTIEDLRKHNLLLKKYQKQKGLKDLLNTPNS